MNIEKRKAFIINGIYITMITLIIFGIIKYVVPLIMPFVIGFIIAMILRPIVDLIAVRLKVQRKWASLAILILFYGTIGLFLFFLIFKLILQVQILFVNLPRIYQVEIEPSITILVTRIQAWILELNPTFQSGLQGIGENLIASLGSIVSNISSYAIKWVTNLLTSIPSALISFLFTVIASFFLTIDYHEILAFVMRQFSEKTNTIVMAIKNNFFGTIMKFVKAYAILMTVTFIELSIGFTLLKVENAIAVAAVIAMIDILPVLGTGGVVIPWIILEVVNGNMTFALGLLIIYLVVTVIRNILEPKVVGDSIGLYPLVTLFCMFIGAKLFGVIGLFGLPIAITILKNLNDNNTIQIFK